MKFRKILPALPWAVAGFAGLGVPVRLWLLDRLPLVSTLFYATPPAVVAFLFFGSAAAWRLRGRKKAASIALAAGVAAGGWAFFAERKSNPPIPLASPRRAFFWNVARGKGGWQAVARAIRSARPDVVALVEAGPATAERAAFWKAEFPDFEIPDFDGGMVLFARGKARLVEAGDLGGKSRYRRFEVDLDGASLNVLLVDLASNPLRSRREPLERLAEIARPLARSPTLILGDFNTPLESVHFRGLRADYRHAFETAGNGWAPTWPVPFPVTTIDHAWASPSLRLGRCALGFTLASDHRPLILDFDFPAVRVQ